MIFEGIAWTADPPHLVRHPGRKDDQTVLERLELDEIALAAMIHQPIKAKRPTRKALRLTVKIVNRADDAMGLARPAAFHLGQILTDDGVAVGSEKGTVAMSGQL
jgi:hypothetical protein